jgi:GAF domain-containing protein/cellulose biosynthesis protein BcsQ
VGKIITFYSYKGGTGRSMAVANVSVLLARWGSKVLVVDWDIEAPGIEYFFRPFIAKPEEIEGKGGVVDLLSASDETLSIDSLRENWKNALVEVHPPDGGQISLLTAGRRSGDYFQRVSAISVEQFYNERGGGRLVEGLRAQWREEFDFVLIDSRTGITDIGGICTIQLPDAVILLFTPTDQALDGIIQVAGRIQTAQLEMPIDRHALVRIPVLSRVDVQQEFTLQQEWMRKAANALKPVYADWLPPDIDPERMLLLSKLPYKPFFGFGERLAVVEEGTNDPAGLGYAYENLAALVARGFQDARLLLEQRDLFTELARSKQPNARNKVFVCCSHSDKALKEELIQHLRVLGTGTELTVWDDEMIKPGSEWIAELDREIQGARAVIILVTAGLLASRFFQESELPAILRRHGAGGLTVLLLVARPCAWQRIHWLAGFQVLPKDGQPLSMQSPSKRESTLAALANTIGVALTGRAKPLPTTATPDGRPFDGHRAERWRRIASSFRAGPEVNTLVENLLDTLSAELGVMAASLYLLDEVTNKLVIQAATGYQKPLIAQRASYGIGEGITGWIARTGETFRANSLEEFKKIPAWKGRLNAPHGIREPQAFLGVPLRVNDRLGSAEKVIGVLKVEDIAPTEEHPEPYFTNEDELLVTMMANVIATVVFNTQVSESRLCRLCVQLQRLSQALAGGPGMEELLDQAIESLAQVLGAEASSLYLLDESSNTVVIRAAAGYQQPLVSQRATYRIGEGITGWIAKMGEAFKANSLEELHRHPAWMGKHNPGQGNREPRAFVGVPLCVQGQSRAIGVLKVEDIECSKEHPEPYFTDGDFLLVSLMANVITAVIHTAHEGEARIGAILRQAGSLSAPKEIVPGLLRDCVRSQDQGIIEQVAIALARSLDANPNRDHQELKALFDARANPELYRRVAYWAESPSVKWSFNLCHMLLASQRQFASTDDLLQAAAPWLALRAGVGDKEAFRAAAKALTRQVADAAQLPMLEDQFDCQEDWFAFLLNIEQLCGGRMQRVPVVFQRGGTLQEANLDRLYRLVMGDPKHTSNILLLFQWEGAWPTDEVEGARRYFGQHAIEIVIVGIADALRLINGKEPQEVLRRMIQRQIRIVSPFVNVGPVPQAMFFGRERELRHVVQGIQAGRSCALIGGRCIGKTSILQRLYRVVLSNRDFRVVYCDGSNLDFQDEASYAQLLGTPLPVRDRTPASAGLDEVTFGDLLEPKQAEKPLILILDESDSLIVASRRNGWPLFKLLRTLSNIRAVFAGGQNLSDALRDPNHALFNWMEPIPLGALAFADVRALITRPFENLAIDLVGERIAADIYSVTGGHPNVVQRFCSRLVARLNEIDKRSIELVDVDAVVADQQFVTEDYLATYWGSAMPIEKVVSLLLAQNPRLRSLEDVRTALSRSLKLEVANNELLDALSRLVELRSILRKTNIGYEFAIDSFPRLVQRAGTLNEQLDSLCDQLRLEMQRQSIP